MCASVFNVHIVIFDEFSIFRVDKNNASNIAKSWIKKSGSRRKNCGKTNQIAKFHRLNGVKHPVCVQIRSRWFANSNSSTSIDNTSIRFIIQCLIVYLPVSFWLLTHWRAVIISLVPKCLHANTRSNYCFFLCSQSHFAMHFACIDETNWLEMKHAAYIKSNRCFFIRLAFFCIEYFPFSCKIAGKTIQYRVWCCRMEMIDNVLYSFTWNQPLVLVFFSLSSILFGKWDDDANAIICNNFHLRLPNTQSSNTTAGNSRLKFIRDMWNWYPDKRVAFSHFQHWFRIIFASSSSPSPCAYGRFLSFGKGQ